MAEELAHQTSGLNIQDPFTSQTRVTPKMAAKFYKSLFGRDVGGRLKEIGLNKPFSYNGAHQDFSAWLSSVKLYLTTNDHIYYEDQSKITFTLSYMGNGSAHAFAEAYVNENTTALGDLKIFDGWDKFVTKLKETFQVGDTKATMLIYLSAIHQGD
ncbi:hypothetical protein M404DRAFT_26094 [Pisolithus tinctorius Marx 270]|uniref:Uncharacterized protein n=1 Tax=Pisolithus tinctorius Marx 270 TaxID=870435 RepID=A0A0C3J6H1_PISTI|nr:hypothetical protein M404DRAFT_26094 [Pisolithus tinctorius Marx 270]